MHEVGHTLGLRHNFKASTWREKSEQLHDSAYTRKNGLVGSVMGLQPGESGPEGRECRATTSPTPSDHTTTGRSTTATAHWPAGTDGEGEELQKVASKSAQPGLDYGTDEDLFGHRRPAHQPVGHGLRPDEVRPRTGWPWPRNS